MNTQEEQDMAQAADQLSESAAAAGDEFDTVEQVAISPTVAASDGDGVVDADALPVTLRFVAGEVDVPFGQVKSVAAGYVFELDKPLDQRLITVYANDMPVATGELVSIGDLVGVQIRRLLTPPRRAQRQA